MQQSYKHQFIVEISAGCRQTVFGSSSIQGDTNNLIETDFLHISMVLRKIDNKVSVYDFFRRKNAPLHQFIAKSLRGGGVGKQFSAQVAPR